MCIRIRIFAFTTLVLAISVAPKQSSAQEQQASWLTTVTVSGDRLSLADMLAPGMDTKLRNAAAGVDLGRSPEPGSFRVFTENQLREVVHADFAFDLPAQIIVRRSGWPIERDQIRAALVRAKLPIAPISLLSEPETRTENAILRVAAAIPGRTPNVSLLRFECQERSECGPFWGEAQYSKDWQRMPISRVVAMQAARRPAALVTPGRPAMLICNGSGMKLRVRVRPLAQAGLGETVRVYDAETRRIFLAHVQAEDLVTSDMLEAR